MTIIDVNVDITQYLVALASKGVTDIIGYLNPHGQTSKVITPQRARALANASPPMSLTLVSEGWGDFAHGDISAVAGTRDAQHALVALLALGAPDGACVYFAVDTDASATQIAKLVMPYFQAIHTAFADSKYRVGVYASGAVCNACLAADLVSLAWLAAPTGWLGSKEFLLGKKWVLHQGLPQTVAGVPCDVDTPNGTDWGQFIPFSEVQILAPQNVAEAQAQVAASVVTPNGLTEAQRVAIADAIQFALVNLAPELAQNVLAAIKEK